MGAGTSGRLGVLDAAECVPTFGVPATQVIGLIAGGDKAMTVAVEGAEDSLELGRQDLIDLKLNENDLVFRNRCQWSDSICNWSFRLR